MKRCLKCFKEYADELEVCPFCGEPELKTSNDSAYLNMGTMLSDGRYIICEKIGSGGFGVVYKAWDTILNTHIAIKEFYSTKLMTRAADSNAVIFHKKTEEECNYRKARFLAEARTMAKFRSHRNIINVFEFFEENNTAYIVMELLEGMTLAAYIKQCCGKIDKDFAIDIALEIAEALKSIHDQGVVHRDVSPDNIYIHSGRELKIKLLDFGAARLVEKIDSVSDIVLKPGYSPPEQYDKNGKLGPWTDIYALGATLYAMLTGIKPTDSILRKKEDTVKDPKVLNQEVSENLSNAIMKALSLDINLRFKEDDDFIAAVKGEITVIPLKAEKQKKNRKRIAAIAATFAIFIMAFASVLLFFQRRLAKEILLPGGTITIWYCDDSDGKKIALEQIEKELEENFQGVDINLRGISPLEYADTLKDAAAEDALPTLFESADASVEVLSKALALDLVFETEEFEQNTILEKYYEACYPDHKQIPLGMILPMVVVVTGGKSEVSVVYPSDSYSGIDNLSAVGSIAVDSKAEKIVNLNYPKFSSEFSETAFLSDQGPSVSFLLTSTKRYTDIKWAKYTTDNKYIFDVKNTITGEFTCEWSIGNGSKNELDNASKILAMMLSKDYQEYLMFKFGISGILPVERSAFIEEGKETDLCLKSEIYDKLVVLN